jgi:acyl dehydratase
MATPGQLGRYFEDFTVGDAYRHPLGRTISEVDNTWFTLLTMNTNQYHFNAHYAQGSPLTGGRMLVNSALTVAVVLGLSVIDISQTAVANLGWTDIRLPNPVYAGDTLYAESLVLHTRESRSRPYAGILTCFTRGLNQHGDEVCSWQRTIMVYKRDAPYDKGHFPAARGGPLRPPTPAEPSPVPPDPPEPPESPPEPSPPGGPG